MNSVFIIVTRGSRPIAAMWSDLSHQENHANSPKVSLSVQDLAVWTVWSWDLDRRPLSHTMAEKCVDQWSTTVLRLTKFSSIFRIPVPMRLVFWIILNLIISAWSFPNMWTSVHYVEQRETRTGIVSFKWTIDPPSVLVVVPRIALHVISPSRSCHSYWFSLTLLCVRINFKFPVRFTIIRGIRRRSIVDVAHDCWHEYMVMTTLMMLL